jgi:2-oxoglutarate dehydrogenase E2 component (dihydrolipoamide succinyltransferase)
MAIEIKVPSLGESESEATLVNWLKQEGEKVEVDDVLAEIESDKITLEITALDAGILKEVRKRAGDKVIPGEVIGLIEEEASARPVEAEKPAAAPVERPEEPTPSEPAQKPEEKQAAPARPEVVSMPETTPRTAAKKSPEAPARGHLEERVPMSSLRRRIARRLKEAQNTAAILTTFNEVNMQVVMDTRRKYRQAFKEKHGVDLGLMSFFTMASVHALKKYPVVNACIEGDDIIYRNYHDIGIAIATERGLVVPILRNVDEMSMAEIERGITDFIHKANSGGLMPDDLKGGTFSISNGGVFGSLLSTPILNPPQSAILGMHRIEKRPVVVDDQVVVRPMMYLALSYDHRLIDGRDAVLFLGAIRDFLEYPGIDLLDL